MPDTCRSCQAPIIWVKTEKGKPMPLDAESGGDGANFIKLRVDPNGDKIVHFVKGRELETNTAPLYRSHFVSCPNRDEHRKKR